MNLTGEIELRQHVKNAQWRGKDGVYKRVFTPLHWGEVHIGPNNPAEYTSEAAFFAGSPTQFADGEDGEFDRVKMQIEPSADPSYDPTTDRELDDYQGPLHWKAVDF